MTDAINPTGTNTKNRPQNKPSHRLFNVTGEGENARWTDIGVAWATKDGKGFTIALNAMPLNGRVVMRINEDRPTTKKKGS
jgi:hypothetical protein